MNGPKSRFSQYFPSDQGEGGLRHGRVPQGLPRSAEIIFADDGSAERLDAIAEADPRVRVLHLSRNYGQTAALMAAIRDSSGDVVIPMDGDGQNDPADIPRLIAKLAEGYDVVSGWRVAREDNALTRRLPSVVANWLISGLLRVPLHDYGCTLKAYRREVLEDVRLYGEMHRFIPIYAAWEGARVTEIAVSHQPRRFGTSKYSAGHIARVLLDLLIPYFIDRRASKSPARCQPVNRALTLLGPKSPSTPSSPRSERAPRGRQRGRHQNRTLWPRLLGSEPPAGF